MILFFPNIWEVGVGGITPACVEELFLVRCLEMTPGCAQGTICSVRD